MGLSEGAEGEEGEKTEGELPAGESLEGDEDVLAASTKPAAVPEVTAGEKQEKLERRRKNSDSGKGLFFDDKDDDWTDFKEEDEEESY
jgi:hypothetical protein